MAWPLALLVAVELTLSFPFVILSQPPKASAVLNQDGSWSIYGNVDDFIYLPVPDDGWLCVVDGLKKRHPVSNPWPDNSRPLSETEMIRILCADSIVRPCLHILNPDIKCRDYTS